MVKLSYITRKIEGVKLANSVCKDIRKKIPKDEFKAAKRVAGSISDNIEMNLTGRKIGDEGLALICETLLEGLENGHFRLVELRLAETSITVAGLAPLSAVIRAASTQLKDLDMANNEISVQNQGDVVAWEDFLRSFSNVCNMIRLDLSGNPLGSEFAGETLLRCYSLSKPIKVEDVNDERSGKKLSDELLLNGLSNQTEEIKQSRSINSGLRSVPFIILKDFDVSEGFALHMSYVIEAHLPANTLLKLHQSGAKPGTDLHSFIQSMEETNYGSYCGVIYQPVRSISVNAHKTLDAAVKEVFPDSDGSSSESEELDPEDSPRVRSKKVQLGVFDVTRCRIKLQGSVLQEGDGSSLVQLWDAAVKMLSATRAIMLTKENRKLFAKRLEAAAAAQLAATTICPVFNPPTPKIQQAQHEASLPPPPPPAVARENYDAAFPSLMTTQSKSNRSSPKPKAISVELAPTAPLTPRNVNKGFIREKKSKKTSPKIKDVKSWDVVKEAPKKETITFVVPRNRTLGSISAFANPSLAPLTEANLTAVMNANVSGPAIPPPLKIETIFDWHKGPPNNLITPISPLGSGKRQLSLPVSLWKRILLQANDPNGLLSQDQFEKIWNFAVSFDTLAIGLEQMRGRRKSDHIWRFLDSVACLSYPIRK